MLFRIGIRIAALFNPKAGKWVEGRKKIFERLETTIPRGEKIIWVHCASLGEFEQGRPLIESLKTNYPTYRILLTFFSPSGYEVQKNYAGADWVFYLPMDSARNAKRFLEWTSPALVIFVKYEFWYYYLKKIKYRNIPLLLISALFRKDMSFFKWYGGLQRKILSRFDRLFVQNEASMALLQEIGLEKISGISGDTRFDRVSSIAGNWKPIPVLDAFSKNSRLIVAGSSWPEDEELLSEAFSVSGNPGCKLVIAPHEINEKHIAELENLFPGALRYSQINNDTPLEKARYLIIDNVGMLSRLYQYAWCCYVGGGLRKSGIHNVLEAAVYGKPVFFGPQYTKYSEAIGLVASGGGIPVNNGKEMAERWLQFLREESFYAGACAASGQFVKSNTGAVQVIMKYIQENRLLTN